MNRKEYIQMQVSSSVWTRQRPHYMALVEDAVAEFKKHVPLNSHVLEMGCGDGYSLDALQKAGYRNLSGCDINIEKLKVAASTNSVVSAQDVHSLGLQNGGFDAVYCTHTLEHSYDGYQAMQEIYRVLRPGGVLFIIVPDHFRVYGDVFLEPYQASSIEARSVNFFEDLHFQRNGKRASLPRNQFPFTMKLLLMTLIHAGFDVQFTARIERDGPELWSFAIKPDGGKEGTRPFFKRM